LRRFGGGAQLVRQLAGQRRFGGEADQRLAVLGVGRIDLEQRRGGAVSGGRILQRAAVERAQLLEPFDPLADAVGDVQQRGVGGGQLGGVVGALVVRERETRDFD